MTRLYVIRHAEAEGNLYRRVHGWYDSLITENGYRQIAALEHRFERIKIDAAYSSDLFRTRTTAGAVYKPKGLMLQTIPTLREIGLGVWEDRTWGELDRSDGAMMRAFNHSSPAFLVEGGESILQVQVRMRNAVLDIAKDYPDQTVAVFSHGTAIRCLQAAIRGLGPGEMDALGHCDNTGVTCLEVENGIHIVFENDNSHLPEEISTFARQKWWKKRQAGINEANLWFRPLDLTREADFYRSAREEAWIDIHGTQIPFDGAGFLADARNHWDYDHRAVMCALQGEQMVGLIQMDFRRFEQEKVGYIPFVYMTPQSRKQGLGVQLIGQAVSTYRTLGRTSLRLRCAPDNGVAQRFYQKYGFHKIGEDQGARVPLDILEKYIGYE